MLNSKCKLLFAVLILWWVSTAYFPDPAEASISNGSVSGNIVVTGGVLTVALPGNTTLNIQSSGSQTPVLGGENITTQFCIPFATSTIARLNCTANFTNNDSGIVTLHNSAAPDYVLDNNSAGAVRTAWVEYQKQGAREWLVGPGLPNTSSTAYSIAEYTAGSFQGIPFSLKKGGPVCLGRDNNACSTSTVSMKDATASTGATRILVELGAADVSSTVTFTNNGTTKSQGYQAMDGTPGMTSAQTIAFCTTANFKNGLFVGCT